MGAEIPLTYTEGQTWAISISQNITEP